MRGWNATLALPLTNLYESNNMSTRVEVLNAGVNRNNIRVRAVRVEDRNGLRVIVEDNVEALQAIPGQRATLHADLSAGTYLLIEEMPGVSRG